VSGIFESLSGAVGGTAAVALLGAFAWGLVSVALSPCHLASVPLAVAFVRRDGAGSRSGMRAVLALGVLASLALVGAVTVAAGRIAGDLWGVGPWLAALALLLCGLYLLGALELPGQFALRQDRIPRNRCGALVIGLFLGLTLGPCTFAFFAPVLAVSIGAAGESPAFSSALVAAFALGHALAIATAGMLGLRVGEWIRRGGVIAARLRALTGVVMLACAILLIATTP